MTALSPPVPARGTPDEIDALSARPDFAILEFPGPLHAAEHVTADSPPLLLGAANDDACCSAPTVDLLQAYRKEIGRAACRERVCQDGEISVVVGSLKKTKEK